MGTSTIKRNLSVVFCTNEKNEFVLSRSEDLLQMFEVSSARTYPVVLFVGVHAQSRYDRRETRVGHTPTSLVPKSRL